MLIKSLPTLQLGYSCPLASPNAHFPYGLGRLSDMLMLE